MTHWMSMMEKSYIGAWSLDGQEVVATIVKVRAGTAPPNPDRPSEKPQRKAIVKLKEFDEELLLNVTNGTTIAKMHGPHVEGWVGKKITLYPTTTKAFGKTVECVRVKPQIPKESVTTQKKPHAAQPLADASNADELLDAIRACAKWIDHNRTERWPKVLELCETHGLEEDRAIERLEASL